jgi:predicted TIM-barrel fold metal-dependent hydrolase
MLSISGQEIAVVDFHVHHPELLGDESPMPEVSSAHELVFQMDKAGIDLAVLLPLDLRYEDFPPHLQIFSEEDFSPIEEQEDELVEFVRGFPERFVGFGSINPNRGEDYIQQRMEQIVMRGFKGIKLLPTFMLFNPADRLPRLLFELAQEKRLIVLSHTGCDPGPWEDPAVSENARPSYLDAVARDFPRLKLVAAHLGCYSSTKPGLWLEEMLEVARRRDNIFADISATFYEYYPDFVLRAVKEMGADRLLFGSDYPTTSTCSRSSGMKEVVDAFLDLPLSSVEKEKILGENARNLLGLLSSTE